MFVDVRCTAVDVVPEDRYRQYGSYHGTPPGKLSRYVDSGITSQMGIRFFAFLVGFSGIHMTIRIIFRVIVNFVISHGVSPHRWFGCWLLSFLPDKLAME